MYLPHIDTSNPLRNTIRQYYHADETKVIKALLPLAQLSVENQVIANQTATELAAQTRQAAQISGGIQQLLNQYALSSNEGIVLMCLAEALLRVSDSTTADHLIRDKLLQGDWLSHIGGSDCLLVNASSWGLLLSARMVAFNSEDQQTHTSKVKKNTGKIAEPIIRLAMRHAVTIMGRQFVLGQTIAEAQRNAQKQQVLGYRYSYDMLGEAARTMKDADYYLAAYNKAIEHIASSQLTTKGENQAIDNRPGISVKLSAIFPRYEFINSTRVMNKLVSRLKSLALSAKKHKLTLTIDAEEADRLDISLDIIETVFTDSALADWDGFGMAVQAYQKRALYVLNWVIELCKRQRCNDKPRKMMLRLVKGAYWDSEIKKAQVDGLDGYPVFTRKASTDVCYQACASLLLQNRDIIFPQFATHNAYSVAYILTRAGADLTGFEFQRLHGMGDGLYEKIMQEHNIAVRIYAPVGEHKSLLAYLVRRLLENGANSSFVNNIIDNNIPLADLVVDPVTTVQSWSQKNHPKIPLPMDIYGGDRPNSQGVDVTDIPRMINMAKTTQAWAKKTVTRGRVMPENIIVSTSPTDRRDILGFMPHTPIDQLSAKLIRANKAYNYWAAMSAEQRAAKLELFAAKLEQHMDELIALCTKEAGKITRDGIAEVREAVDFCRYYANQGRKVYSPQPQWDEHQALTSRGVVVCISPWNFPLAIFLGQVTAALAAGNSVLAKPADASCLIASRAVELMAECGFPQNVVQLILTPGKIVGEKLLPHKHVAAVMFTGSTEVGAWIAQQLAKRPGQRIPLIAETGGQNCLIVDSTALPEQVVDDVISSGFQSAGQRCSALRVLFLQEEIADQIINMIVGAMRELEVGDPAYLGTDIGPVINQQALAKLHDHSKFMETHGSLLYQCELAKQYQHGTFFAPCLYEIDSINVLEREVFGPIVHVVRYQACDIDQALADINSTGFGLTFGLHSRIQAMHNKVINTVNAGNIYINRNIIGAVVGVQPFGGRGLSGTGPKAGGPNYVCRLMKQTPNEANSHNKQINDKLSFNFSRLCMIEKHPNAINSQLLNCQQPRFNPSISHRVKQVKTLISLLLQDKYLELSENLAQQVSAMADEVLNTQLAPVILPGPTGELNQLIYEARGTILCLHQDEHYFEDAIRQMIAALLTGNNVVHVSDSIFDISKYIEQAELIDAYQRLSIHSQQQLLDCLMAKHLDGIAVSGSLLLQQWVDNAIIKRHGPIIPLIIETNGPVLIPRFTLEKVVSINTTAAGGNTSLLSIGDE